MSLQHAPTRENFRRRLRTKGAAEYVGLAESTLEKDRITGALGIPFIKAGRSVVYDTADLDGWLAAHRRRSTSDPGVGAEEARKAEAEEARKAVRARAKDAEAKEARAAAPTPTGPQAG